MIFMGTPLMQLKSLTQLLLFIPQPWKIPKPTEAEESQEVTEDPIKDEDQDRAEERIEEHREEMTTDKDPIEGLEEDKDPIEDSEEGKIKDNDPAEAHGEDQTEDIEVEDQHSLMPTIGTVWYAKREGTTTFQTAQSYQNIFPEVTMSYLPLKNYVNYASRPLATTRIVLTHTPGITGIGCATCTK